MFHRVESSLPAFESYSNMHLVHSKSGSGSKNPSENTRHIRLRNAITDICIEMFQFVRDCCSIFATKTDNQSLSIKSRRGCFDEDMLRRLRTPILSWKPFDEKFSVRLDRLRTYQQIVGWEMVLEESKSRESQYTKQAGQSGLTEEVRRQIERELEDLRMSNERWELRIITQYNTIQQERRRQHEGEDSSTGVAREYEKLMSTSNPTHYTITDAVRL